MFAFGRGAAASVGLALGVILTGSSSEDPPAMSIPVPNNAVNNNELGTLRDRIGCFPLCRESNTNNDGPPPVFPAVSGPCKTSEKHRFPTAL